MGTGMSLPKETFIIGKSNKNSHGLYRLYNVQDHLFPYELNTDRNPFENITLSLALNAFNGLVSQKLGKASHRSQLTEDELDEYKAALDPSKVLQQLLVTSLEAKDVKIEMSCKDKQIYLCRNYLVEVDELLAELNSVTILQLCCNYLRLLPYGIGQLKQLKMLIVSRNRIIELPEEIGLCKELREIDVSHNLIRSLPRSIAGLKKLNTFHLGSNLIENIPNFLGKLNSLKYLNLSNNPIKAVPLEVLKLPFLISLNCNGCNLNLDRKKFEVVGEMNLKETIARNIIRKNLPIRKSLVSSLKAFLMDAKECSFCGGPFFDYFVEIEDTLVFESESLPIYYKMCCTHYHRHEDRLSTLFERTVHTFPTRIFEDNLPSITEIFEPICFDDRQKKIMNEGFESKEKTMPLISLARYNMNKFRGRSIDSISQNDYENVNFFDEQPAQI